jgi:hypothetical protein
LHVNDGSGHLAQGGQAGQAVCLGQIAASGHLGQMGGIISDLRIYISSLPFAISDFLIPRIPSTVRDPKLTNIINPNNMNKIRDNFTFII